ncbi:glucose 1-dehydrogenase [Variovorax sp. PvP013]|uniref:glucose 1-dehydrogenase n=1 Tax=Variovorax sp. PvP013 TaxID=3156435 RepID=UPI003D245309
MSDQQANHFPEPPFDTPSQSYPGSTERMNPHPDHGEESYRGSGRLAGKVAIVTGADSGIGRAVAIAYAREGADLVLAYLDEHDDAAETARWVEQAGRKAVVVAADIAQRESAKVIVAKAVDAFGRIDVLVNNAGFQKCADSIDEITEEDWEHHFAVNVHAMFYLIKAACAHMAPGSSIINTASMNAKMPMPRQVAYSATKASITNITANLAKLLAEKHIRVNAVLPGPIWTPLIPATMNDEEVEGFGQQVPMKRPGQPVEVAPPFVMLASNEGSYISGAMIAVTGGAALL